MANESGGAPLRVDHRLSSVIPFGIKRNKIFEHRYLKRGMLFCVCLLILKSITAP